MQSTCLDVDRWARNVCTCFKHAHKTWLKINFLPWVWCRAVFSLHSVEGSVRRMLLLSMQFPLLSSLLWKWVYVDYSPTSMLLGPSAAHPLLLFTHFWSPDEDCGAFFCFPAVMWANDMNSWARFVHSHALSDSVAFFHMERFWYSLGQLVGFTDSLWI